MTAGVLTASGPVALHRIRPEDLAEISRHLFTVSIVEPLTDLARLREVHGQTGLWGEDAGALAIEAEGRMVGTCQFYRASPVIHGYELGYIVHDEADRGKGYAKIAARLLTDWLFDNRPACHRLQLLIETYNIASWSLAERIGYHREGLLRSAGFTSDTPEDCYLYARTRVDHARG